MEVYKTIQGDTFDIIAKKEYGDEKYIKELMEANAEHLSTLIFSAGISIKIPEITEEQTNNNLPPWRG